MAPRRSRRAGDRGVPPLDAKEAERRLGTPRGTLFCMSCACERRPAAFRPNPLPPVALAGLWACAAAAMAGGLYLIATSFKTKINEPAPLPNFTPQGPVTILV